MENSNYDEILAQANHIISKMETDNLSINELSQKLDEAYSLIERLKNQLFETEIQVEQIINSRNTLNNSEEDKHGSQ
ncbi:exodeoxyribonuclease VII small subunit [Fluviispira multicolorata]|nr:exodeoxyribonuclease VII small subunit [Fluviispira multicolorata]